MALLTAYIAASDAFSLNLVKWTKLMDQKIPQKCVDKVKKWELGPRGEM